MKTLVFDSYEEAEEYLIELYPDKTPDVKICYRDGLLVWDVWNGNRAFFDTKSEIFENNFYWYRNQDVAFSRDEKTLHLGEYWGEHSGFYTKQ